LLPGISLEAVPNRGQVKLVIQVRAVDAAARVFRAFDHSGATRTQATGAGLIAPARRQVASRRDLDPRACRRAYGFFAPLGDLLVPGPTFTNVNDFRALLVV
jgi:glycerate-2-kinase